jgi:hypothetical protein
VKPDDLERLLADEDEITPSSSFLTSVMAAVHREAAAPRALEFPWLRALPGLLATIAALAVATWQGIASLSDPGASAVLDAELGEVMTAAAGLGLQWVALAAIVTIVSVWLPLRLRVARSTFRGA